MTGVYVSSPIDQANGEAFAVVSKVKSWLGRHDQVSWVYDPSNAFDTGLGSRDSGIRDINLNALHRASVVIAVLPKGTVSIGTPMEVDRAVLLGKHVLVISNAPSWMLEFGEGEPNAATFDGWDHRAQSWLDSRLGLKVDPAIGTAEYLPVLAESADLLPVRAYNDDAGLDLFVSEDTIIPPGQFVDVPCGISVQLPDWSWGMITGRSSTLRKRGLLVHTGVIDCGYRGPLFCGAWNMTDKPVEVKAGERVSQLILLENSTARVQPALSLELENSPRGESGFGSSGA